MRKFILINIFIFFSINTQCQRVNYNMLTETSNAHSISETYYYNSSIYSGICYDVFENGNTKLQGNILDGKRNGIWKSFFEDGNIKNITQYDLGREDSCWLYLFPNGNLQKEINFANGKRFGICKNYFKNNQLKKCGYYLNNFKHGNWEWYNLNGNIRHKTTFSDGEIISETCFDKNGKEINCD